MPLTVRFGADERSDITPKEFWARCRQTSVLPETAAPSPGAFTDAFRRAAEAGADGVVCINLSSRLSATIQAAQAAAKEVADVPVRVIDSLSVSFGQGLQVLAAAEQAEAGKSLDEVADAVEGMVAGTRCSASSTRWRISRRAGGSAAPRPCSDPCCRSSRSSRSSTVRSRRSPSSAPAAGRFAIWPTRSPEAAKSGQIARLAVMHGDASDFDEFLDLLAPPVPRDDMLVGWVGPVIGAHAGPGVVGCAWTSPPS